MQMNNGPIKTVKVAFVDFNNIVKPTDNDFYRVLSKKYQVVIDNESPEYVFYSCYGNKHLDYDCIRIFYTEECYSPDFNEADYAIGFDRIEFGDRYFRKPLYDLFQYKKPYRDLFSPRHFDNSILLTKRKFCSFVVSNCFADDVRAVFFDKLSKYKRVESGGRFKNNIGYPIHDKKQFQAECKFAIAFENCSYPGYVTEKLAEAFESGCVPIYYGAPDVNVEFNENAFVNVNRFISIDDAINYIIELDNDDEKYLSVLNESPIKVVPDDSSFESFLYNIFDVSIEKAKRRPCSFWTKHSEKVKRRHASSERLFSYYDKLNNLIGRVRKGSIIKGTATIYNDSFNK